MTDVIDDLSPLDDSPHSTREDWLTAAVVALRPRFEAKGFTLASQIRVTCGLPSTARRSGTLGETWADTASRDGTIEIMVSPVLDDPVDVLTVLLAQLCHAAPGALNTGAAYRLAAVAMNLEPLRSDFKAVRGDQDFLNVYADLLNDLGVYPHAALNPSMLKAQKQATRMLKAVCTCGYTIRLTSKWAAKGLPVCPCGNPFTLA